ncbi:hypothetical protein DFJ73DRAFT_84775 [Zopfochytrium polystomum]|nr:hypothetical protein DFJ73DRAFT_84775 [Zopfochytrium polystomum]
MFRDRTKARLEEVSMSIVGRALRRRDGGGGRARRNGNWAPKQFGWCGYLLLWGFSASACYPFSPTPPLRLRNPKVFPQILSQRVPCFVQTQRRTRGAQFLTLFVGWLSPESHRRLVTLDLRRPTQKIEMKPYTTAPTCHLSPESESSSLSRLNSQQLVRPHLAMHNHIGSSTAPQTATHKSARKQHSLNSGRGLPEEQREALASHE